MLSNAARDDNTRQSKFSTSLNSETRVWNTHSSVQRIAELLWYEHITASLSVYKYVHGIKRGVKRSIVETHYDGDSVDMGPFGMMRQEQLCSRLSLSAITSFHDNMGGCAESTAKKNKTQVRIYLRCLD